MAELLLELFSEEIPARMQARAEEDLTRLVAAALKDAGLEFKRMDAYSTPRRLVLHVDGLPAATPDIKEERRGPRVDAPEKAIEGFLKSAGVSRDACEEREDKKGTFLFAVIERPGRPTADLLAEAIPAVVGDFPWPKSMRWARERMRWVRPLHTVLCQFDGDVVPFDAGPVASDKLTAGHRFMAPGTFEVEDFADYRAKLEAAYVLIDRAERRQRILKGARALAKKAKLEPVEDEGLLEEVTGLVEWPLPLIAAFDPAFLDLPPEVLVSEMRHHQKYFALRDPKSGALAPKFVVIANIETEDKGQAIAAGNARVLAARLADARFFWQQDRKRALEDNLPALDDIVFHDKLGSVGEKARRVSDLAARLAAHIPGCDAKKAARAGLLAKADLVSGMVGEFPDLQGIMGGYYAAAGGEPEAVAEAIRSHYAPRGPADACPTAPEAIAVALADKLDTIVGFFGIDETPTGSKDPFALRRAALGIIRLITDNGLRLSLHAAVMDAESGYLEQALKAGKAARKFSVQGDALWHALDGFIADRLKVQTREKGVRHDLIDAVFSLHDEDDLVRILDRVAALQDFLTTDDGENLLAGSKRAMNIVRIEEKKDGTTYDGEPGATLLMQDEEKALFKLLLKQADAVTKAAAKEDFAGAMAAIAVLRAPIDAFFDEVTVNTEDAGVRANRLKLLARIGASLGAVADFSKIES